MKMESGDEMDQESDTGRKLNVNRAVYTLDKYNDKYPLPEARTTTFTDRLKGACSARNVTKGLLSYFPMLKVVRKYKVRQYVLGDFLAGLTVSFMHLPQGMAFGLMASLRPIYGLYSTFFPLLFYMLFGTSPYISFGTNAVMALLTQTVVEREAEAFINTFPMVTNISANITSSGPTEAEVLNIKVGTAMACSFLSGILLALMGFLKLGFLTSYLSTSFIGGFTTAAAVHITTSQIPKMFGIKTESYSGGGKLVLVYIDLFRKIARTKVADFVIAIISMAVLLAVKIGINERYKDKMKMPIPIDLVIVVVATLISYLAKFKDEFNVNIVGSIPSGFEAPSLPRLDNASGFFADAIVMGVLSLAMTITLAKLTAKKHGIKIDDSQELVAYGLGNVFSSFFGCFPSATAPPRTMILSSLGAKTTLNAIPTLTVFVLIILVIGQLFESLPIPVLAAMIIVSMKDLLLQYRNLPNIWRINKYDFIIWVVTNSCAVLIDLDYGLIIGIGVSVLLVVVQNQLASGYLVDLASYEDVLYRTNKNANGSDVAIFRFPVGLYFATADRFRTHIYKTVLNPQTYLKQLKQLDKSLGADMVQVTDETVKSSNDKRLDGTLDAESNTIQDGRQITKPRVVIIDCSMMQYIDMAGTNALQDVIKQYKGLDIQVSLTGIPKTAEKVLRNGGFFDSFSKSNVFLDVFDALEMADYKTKKYVQHL